MNPNGTRYVATAFTTGGVIKAIMLKLIAHIDDYAFWVIQFGRNLIRRYKASGIEFGLKQGWLSSMGRCTDQAATLLPCI
jgi:hypothetical protein